MPDVADIRREAITQIVGLLDNHLNKAPSTNIVELWKEHQAIRRTLEEASANQAKLANTDKDLARKRSKETLTKFNDWAAHCGVKSESIAVTQCNAVGGFGLKAKTDISQGSVLVSVPRHAMISTDIAKKSAVLKKAFERDPIVQGMDNVGLALYLSCQRLSTDSKWTPYLDVLPSQFTTPLFYTEDELLDLKPSPIFEESILFYRAVARQFCYFYMQVSKNDLYESMRKKNRTNEQPPPLYNTPFTVDNFTFSLYRWAVCCVTTRINLVPSGVERNRDGSPKLIPALIPVLDMANHELSDEIDGEDESPVLYSRETDSAEIVAHKSIAKNGDVTIYYGRRSNADHLLHNGFVPAGENPHDRYKLKIALPRSDKFYDEKKKLIEELGFNGWSQSNVFVYDIALGPEPFHPTLETFAKVYVVEKPNKENLDLPQTMNKAVSFLKNRFALLERAYGNIESGATVNEKNIELLKRSELVIISNARSFCENWEKQLFVVVEKPAS